MLLSFENFFFILESTLKVLFSWLFIMAIGPEYWGWLDVTWCFLVLFRYILNPWSGLGGPGPCPPALPELESPYSEDDFSYSTGGLSLSQVYILSPTSRSEHWPLPRTSPSSSLANPSTPCGLQIKSNFSKKNFLGSPKSPSLCHNQSLRSLDLLLLWLQTRFLKIMFGCRWQIVILHWHLYLSWFLKTRH